MLNAGFTTLFALKIRLLPEASVEVTTWDAALSALGLAIAGRMERYASRKLGYEAEAVDEFHARTLAVTVMRYPLVAVETVQVRAPDNVLRLVTASDYQTDKPCGLITFYTPPGSAMERLVITYAGGYWLDPDTDAGSVERMPEDLVEAFIAEVQRHAEARGMFEAVGLRTAKDAQKSLAPGALTEECQEVLRSYRRFAGE